MVLRLGQVNYINVLPVFYPLEAGWVQSPAELVAGTPAECNRLLEQGGIDVGVVSSIQYARHQESLVLLPDLSISCEGSVGSVLLFSKDRIDQLDGRQIALTSSSATSVALVKVLCRWYYQIQAEFMVMEPDLEKMLSAAPACLLIGDDALRARKRADGLVVEDMGKAWWIFTGLPMVFAVWAARKDSVARQPEAFAELVLSLYRARQVGKDNIDTVIDEARARVGLSEEELRTYYMQQKYELNPTYQRGLLAFYSYCARLRLAPRVSALEFFKLPK